MVRFGSSLRSAVVRAPMVRLVLPLIIGLLLSRVLMPELRVALAACALCFATWSIFASRIRVKHRWGRGLILFLAVCSFGIAWQRVRDRSGATSDLSWHAAHLQAERMRIVEVVSAHGRTLRAWADVDAGLVDGRIEPLEGTVLLTVVCDSGVAQPRAGEVLFVAARPKPIIRVPDPGGFDMRQWAASYGAGYEVFASVGKWQRLSAPQGWSAFFDGARDRITTWLERSALDGRERGMVKAILLGIRDELDQDQKTSFARSGTMHVLAVSGSHVAIIYGALFIALRGLGEKQRWRIVRAAAILLVLWFYAGLTGFTPSVLRATLTFTLFCIADMTRWRTDPINSLAASAFVLLVWDPRMLTQLSFQLSFLAVLGIAFFYRPLHDLWAPRTWVMRYAWSLFAVSMAAQAFTTPLSLLTFKAFPVWFIPANLVIVGLVSLGVYGGTALLVFHAVPWIGDAITWAMAMLLRVLAWSAQFFATLPGAYPDVRIDVWQCLGLYALVLALSAWWLEGWSSARTATLVIILLLLGSWAMTAGERSQEHAFVVYDERDRLACAVQNGRALVVFADSLDDRLLRKVEEHRRSCGALMVQDTASLPQVISMGRDRYLLIDAQDVPEALPAGQCTAVVLARDGRYDLEGLVRVLKPSAGFVLSPTLSNAKRAFIRKWSAAHGVAVHDVRLNGAYVR